MRRLIIIPLFLTCFFACKQGVKMNSNEITGDYKSGDHWVTVERQNQKIDVSLCFSDETCVEPCYSGLLERADQKKFSGWLYPDETEDSTADKILVVINFFKDELEVLFPQGKPSLGASCDPERVYKKE